MYWYYQIYYFFEILDISKLLKGKKVFVWCLVSQMKVETIDKILPQGWETFGSLDQPRLVFNCYEIYFDDTLK
jgi:hypothetical protein